MSASQQKVEVQITDVAKTATLAGHPVYKLSYKYNFPALKKLYIRGVGVVPAAGTFTYLADSPSVEFRDASGGVLLALASSEHIGSAPVVDLPAQTDFQQPPVGRDEPWKYVHPFNEAISAVISRKRLFAYRHEQDGISYVTTTYAALEGLPRNIFGKIALRISHPYHKDGKFVWYRVEFTARERRPKVEPWRTPQSPEIQIASTKFVEDFVADLQKLGTGSK